MRAAALSIVCVAFAFSTPLQAQEKPSLTVDDYLCAFTGKCSKSEAEEDSSREAPETKGFKLYRPTTPASPNAGGTARAAAGNTGASVKVNMRQPVRPAASGKGRTKPQNYAAVTRASRYVPAVVGRRMDLRLNFELGSDRLTEQARAQADVLAETLRHPEMAEKKLLIEGHTDSIGGRAYNLNLSRRRAAAVVEYLSSRGVDSRKLATRGFAYDRPVEGHSIAAPENRRVEAVVLN